MKNINKLIKVEYMEQENETRRDQTASYQGNGHMTMQYNQETTINIKHCGSSNFDNNMFLKKDENSDNEMIQCESRYNSGYQNKNDVCNRKNQCYKLTKSFIESLEPIIPTLSAFNKVDDYLSHENHSSYMSNNYTESTDSNILISSTEYQNRSFVNIDKQIRESIFNKIMTLKLKKKRCTQEIYSLYFNSPKIRNIFSPEESMDLPNDDIAMMKQSLTTELNAFIK
uniref:Uncharacterized protein n=1 Tax=Schizaphis graminum TaxID=13262 RepID=A0A2S2PAW7_SCHGA